MEENYKQIIINDKKTDISNSSDRDLYFDIKKIKEEAEKLNQEQEEILKQIISWFWFLWGKNGYKRG